MNWKTALFAALCAISSGMLSAQENPAEVIPAPTGAIKVPPETVEAVEAARDDAIAAVVDAAEAAANRDAYPRDPQPINWRSLSTLSSDYPPQSWVNGEEGRVYFEVTIDADGKVASCEVTQSSGYPLLDARTCEIQMERGEFLPARDETNAPVEGIYFGQVRWEKREHEFPGTSAIEVYFDVSESGETSNCEIVEVSGKLSQRTLGQLEERPCPFSSRNGRNIYRDENGVPVAKKVRFRVEVTVEDPE